MFTRAAPLVLLALLAACASAQQPDELPPPRYGDEFMDAPGARTFASLGMPGAVRDVALTVYPTARTAEYGAVLLPLEGARIVDEQSDEVDARLRDAGLEIGWNELPPEGYVLAVSQDAGRTVVLTCARDAAGRRWAAQALAQVTWSEGGRSWARACRVLDAPVFPLRGNKRPQPWEVAYRANFAWEARNEPAFAGRETVATAAPGSPFDATPQAVAALLETWRPWQEKGVRRFCVKFDDVGFGLTMESRAYYGEYAPALVAFLEQLGHGLRRRDPAAVLYLLPQTYWWRDPRFAAYATALRAAGGLPEDVGLVMTGPDVISDAIGTEGLAGARFEMGAVRTPALLYDNQGREGDWGPMTGRDARLRTQCEGVFGERGTPVHRLTRLDWLWNPIRYDPERSYRRAVLELAGMDGYEDLLAVCDAFRRGAPREDAAAALRAFEGASRGAGAPVLHGKLSALLRADLSRLTPGGDQRAARR